MQAPDRRRNAWRADLADAALGDAVDTPRRVEGVTMRVRAPVLDLFADPGRKRLGSQLLHGEAVRVFDTDPGSGLAWVQNRADGYVGYAPLEGLATGGPGTHRITARFAPVFPDPDMKAPVRLSLPMCALVQPGAQEGDFVAVEGGWLHRRHLAPLAGDMVAVARLFLGAPYLWGGRSPAGLDCSALVQLSAAACGIPAPRDSDMQAAELGDAIAVEDGLVRGDLVFWKGHVGLMADADTLLHATGHHMAVVEEPFDGAVARIIAGGNGPVTAARRL